MILYLLRHSKAAKDETGQRDSERKLTAKGKADAFKKANKLRKKLSDVELVLTSPYPRALETAEIFAAVLKRNEVLVQDDMLIASARAEDILRHLRNFTRHNEILLVGHEPWMTELASLLFSGTLQCQIHLKKPGLITLDVEVMAPRGATLLSLS